jgi:hypothetical protein
MNDQDYISAAGLFNVLTETAAAMREAEKTKQFWKREIVAMRDENGERNGGLDIRIRIYPPGVTPDPRQFITEEVLSSVLKQEAPEVAEAS